MLRQSPLPSDCDLSRVMLGSCQPVSGPPCIVVCAAQLARSFRAGAMCWMPGESVVS